MIQLTHGLKMIRNLTFSIGLLGFYCLDPEANIAEAIFASGSTSILHQRYKVIMLAMTTHKANGLSPPPMLTYTRSTIMPEIPTDAFAYVTNILSTILPPELILLIDTILLLILIIGSWIIYRLNRHYSSKTRLILRILADTVFGKQITTLSYTPDCYRISIVSNEFTIMNTCGKSQANFGSLFTVYDLISQEFLALLTTFLWSARCVHDIVNDRKGFGICLLVNDTRGSILDVIAIRKRQLQRSMLPRDFAINYTPINQSLTSLRNATAPTASYDQTKDSVHLYPGH